MGEKVAIVGIGQTYHKNTRPEVSIGEMVNEAVQAALEDAQLTIKDVDSVLCSNMDFFEGIYLSDMVHSGYTGAYLKPGMKIQTGGTTGGSVACAAWYHIASGIHDVVMTVAYQKLDTPISAQTALISACDHIYDATFVAGAVGYFGLLASQYMQESGAREEHAAMCRVKTDKNASLNPHSHLKLDISVDDVLNSRTLAYPLRLLHMCPASCGACAVIMASEKKAEKITRKPVWYRDHVTVHQETFSPPLPIGSVAPPSTKTVAAKKLFSRNGITNPRKELQVFEMYDPASWAELAWCEEFLLCEKGEAWKLLEKGVWDLDGEFPINPSGGVVATNPIGATALIRVAEAALQVRGDAGEHQVARDVNKAIASAFGGSNYTVLHLLTKSKND
jgi:acetyl-CoA C-acetyltransferase